MSLEGKMDKIVIKEASKKDAEILQQIEANDGYPYPYKKTPADYEKYIEEGNIFYMAYIEDNPIAYIAIKSEGNDHRHYSRLHFIAVKKQNQGEGIGTQLINYAEEKVRQKGKLGMYVVLYEKNLNAEKFYIKQNYKFWYYVPEMYEEGIGGKIYRKVLNPEKSKKFYEKPI